MSVLTMFCCGTLKYALRMGFFVFLLCATDFSRKFCRAKIRDGVAFCQLSCWFCHICCCLSQHV